MKYETLGKYMLYIEPNFSERVYKAVICHLFPLNSGASIKRPQNKNVGFFPKCWLRLVWPT